MTMIQRLSEIQDLPTLPEIALRIHSLIVSEDGDATMLSNLIEQDPSLSAKILKIANSSFYCTSNKRIISAKAAITRIGFNEIGHIALAMSLIRQFSKVSTIIDYKQFWKHSLSAAHLASFTRDSHSNPDFIHQVFLAGLFHDIGILICDQFFHKEYEHIIEHAMKKEIPFLDAERELFPNETHAMLGSALLELWKIDLPIVMGIRYHHNPEKAPENYRSIAWAVYLSEYILCNSVLGSFEGMILQGNKHVINSLGLTSDMIASYLKLANYEVSRSELIMALENENDVFQLRAV